MYFVEGNNKLNFGGSDYNNESNFQYLKYGQVVSVDDPNGFGRIKVRIKGSQSAGGDDGVADSALPDALPLIPRHLYVVPKKGDAVWVLVLDKNRQHVDRLYIGPVISSLNKLSEDDCYTSAMGGFSFGCFDGPINIDNIPKLKGVFPNKEDISIQGRYNTEVTQKHNEVIIRAGKFVTSPITDKNPYNFEFNSTTQAYIQIINDVQLSKVNPEQNVPNKGTITNIVSNKINLLTHRDGNPSFSLTGQDKLISDEEMLNILENAHPIPYGDNLIKYLKLFREAFFSHVHNGNGNPPTKKTTGNDNSYTEFEKTAQALENEMLSKNIKIN